MASAIIQQLAGDHFRSVNCGSDCSSRDFRGDSTANRPRDRKTISKYLENRGSGKPQWSL